MMSSANPRRIGQTAHGSARPIVHGPERPARAGEIAVSDLDLDPNARLTLAVMRWYFQSFALPESQGWLMAMRVAAAHLGPDRAGRLCHDVVTLIQTLRVSRATTFSFNSEGCACCRVWLTPDERRLMELLVAMRQNQDGRARTITQFLCDGVCNEDLMIAARYFVTRHMQGQDLRA